MKSKKRMARDPYFCAKTMILAYMKHLLVYVNKLNSIMGIGLHTEVLVSMPSDRARNWSENIFSIILKGIPVFF